VRVVGRLGPDVAKGSDFARGYVGHDVGLARITEKQLDIFCQTRNAER